MYTPKDIQVFFFAHNRAEFLRQAVECYLNQTVRGAELVILANAPTDDVVQVGRAYEKKGVKLMLEPKPLNVYGCAQRCQETACRAITVMAHDDDLIHPAYLETLLKAYNQIPDLNVAISSMQDWDNEPFPPDCHTRCALLDESEFSAYIFLGGSFTYSSASYKTQALRQAPRPDFARYGKVQDVPFMLGVCAVNNGKAAVLQYPFVKYRLHEGQDCQTFSTGPTAAQWLELDGLHRELMCRRDGSLRRAWKLNTYHRLRIGWRDWCLCEHEKMTFSSYLAAARQKGLLPPLSRVAGLLLRGDLRKNVLRRLFTPEIISL